MPSFDNIPSDILRIVFLLLKDDQLSMRESLASVCIHWRAIMLDIGEYWTRIKIKRAKNISFIEYLNTYITKLVSRAGTHFLDIEWNVELGMLYFRPPLEIFDQLFKHASTSRWRSLRIQQPINLPDKALRCGFPVLESLEVDCALSGIPSSLFKSIEKTAVGISSLTVKDRNTWIELEPKIPTTSARITSLRIVKDRGSDISTLPVSITTLNAPRFAFQSDQTASFPSIKSLTTTHPLDTPTKTPNIETLALHIVGTHYASATFTSPFPIPNLRTLIIVGYPVMISLQYSAPNLENLSIDVCRQPFCHKGCTGDYLRDVLCFPSNPSELPFPKLLSIIARISCDHSSAVGEQTDDMHYWRECALDILERRKETLMLFIEFVRDRTGFVFRYDHNMLIACKSNGQK
jgi:hypothetical protein